MNKLWFAWKIVLLQYRKQREKKDYICKVGCDLLEKSYFCSIANNCRLQCAYKGLVVICLKNRTFAVSQTTCFGATSASSTLWFAWKIVLLQYRKQPQCCRQRTGCSCDLLEKSYFCSIANNVCHANAVIRALWFAWKIVLLQYRKQLKHHIYLYHKQIQRFKK